MDTNQKVEHVRQLMKANDISAVVIPSDDPHGSEYVADHWQARKWLTGFSGSAGTAVVTFEHAILWTDFRYYIQAENQISGSCFQLYKMGETGVPDFSKWLMDTLAETDIIGIDGNVISMANVKKYEAMFKAKGIGLDTKINILKDLWGDRPPLPMSAAFSFSVTFAGKSRRDKIKEIREKMGAWNADYHVMASLDDIAWTLNLRGDDVHTNPVNIAFCLIGPGRVTLFLSKEKVGADLVEELKQDGIDIAEYKDISVALSNIPDGKSIVIDPENINYRLCQSINKKCSIVKKTNPAIKFKSVKNETEIRHLQKTAVKDGTAVVNFLYWIEQQKKSGQMTEMSVADRLYTCRKAQDLFIDNSFDPIMAFREHSAMCHYSATRQTDVTIGDKGMFLTDSGGHYLTGTTDITRTVFFGNPSSQEKTDYTLVLKGHVCVATAVFPKGTKGFQIDTLARQFLWRQGMDFGHGTGHGVGFFLCVHEGPARISPHPVDVKLKKGMVLTNEPGIYREGFYGIRLENMVLVDEAFENEFGTFMKFENMTYCHFERNLIDENMLTSEEKDWIDRYHAGVYEKLSPHIEPDVAVWLKEKTRPL